MNYFKRIATLGLAVAVAGCGSDSMTATTSKLTLSAAQSAALMTRIQQISVATPELSWLADSANVVLAAGAEADSVPITTTRTAAQFYAVALQRRFPSASSAFSTFTFIAFDSPDAPTDFIVLDGYASGGAAGPPQSLSTSFGSSNSQSLFGYVFHVSGSTLTTWKAFGDSSASLVSAASTGSCAQAVTGATCSQAGLLTRFSMDAGADTVGSVVTPRTASMAATTVAGIALTFPIH